MGLRFRQGRNYKSISLEKHTYSCGFFFKPDIFFWVFFAEQFQNPFIAFSITHFLEKKHRSHKTLVPFQFRLLNFNCTEVISWQHQILMHSDFPPLQYISSFPQITWGPSQHIAEQFKDAQYPLDKAAAVNLQGQSSVLFCLVSKPLSMLY